MPDEYKRPMYYNCIAEDPILSTKAVREHHSGSPPELTVVGKDKRTNNNLPACNADRLLELSCILLVRTFH